MTENELIAKISLLKKIEPRKDWVLLTKTRIMTQNPAEQYAEPRGTLIGQALLRQGFGGELGHIIDTFSFIFNRPAFAVAGFAILIASGFLFQFNQQRLAQDAVAQLALAQERLEQLQKIAESANKGDFKGGLTGDLKGDLSAALKEFQETSAELSRQVAGFEAKDHAKALQAGIGIIQLQKSAADLERVYGISIGEKAQEDLQTTVKTLIENELADLATRTLSAEQQVLFGQAQAAFEAGDYETALEKIWAISN